MSDDKKKVGKPDRDRINPDEDYELQDWAKHFGVEQGQNQADRAESRSARERRRESA